MRTNRPPWVPDGIMQWCRKHHWWGTDQRCPECHPRDSRQMEHSRGPDADPTLIKGYMQSAMHPGREAQVLTGQPLSRCPDPYDTEESRR